MGTPYSTVMDKLSHKINSEIFNLSDEEIDRIIMNWMDSACTYYHNSPESLMHDNESQTFVEDLSNDTIEILAAYTMLQWLETEFIATPTLLRSHMVSREFQAWSPGKQLETLMKLRDTTRTYLAYKANIMSYGANGRNPKGSFVDRFMKQYAERE